MRGLMVLAAAAAGLWMLRRKPRPSEPYTPAPWDSRVVDPSDANRFGVYHILRGECLGTIVRTERGLVWEHAGVCPPGTRETFDAERHLDEVLALE